MENTNRDTDQNASPQNDWQNAVINAVVTNSSDTQGDEIRKTVSERYGLNDYFDERLNAMEDKAEPEENEEADTEEEEAGDWGHVDPADGNSPFPDTNEPSAPGSAV